MQRGFTRKRSWRTAALALTVCLATAVATSCDKMPLSAPTESTITLYATSTTVGLNASIEIIATVIESGGTPVQNGTVVNFTTTLGVIEPVEARTNNGKATVRLVAGTKSGTAEVRAFSGGVSSGEALKIAVGAAAVGKVELLANPSALPAAGGVVQLTAIVNDASGNRLAGVSVSFTTDAGLLAINSVTSDANGEARTSLSTTGTAKVTASVAGGSSESASATLSIPVRVGPSVAISAPAILLRGVPAVFEVTVSAGGAAVRTATIDFGDGGTQSVSTSGKSTVTHTYGASGLYNVTAVATDAVGDSASALASVSVQAVIVNVTLSWSPTTVKTNVPVDFTATVTTYPAGAVVTRYQWFVNGVLIATTSGNQMSYIPPAAGTYEVRVRAETTSGASGEALRYVVVVNP